MTTVQLSKTRADAIARIKTAIVSGMKAGAERRQDLLLRSWHGIPLNCKGGQGYDRDMRRLVSEGLCRVQRQARGGSTQTISILAITQQGIDVLATRGFGTNRPVEAGFSVHAQPKLTITTKTRRVLRRKERVVVHQIADSLIEDFNDLGPRPSPLQLQWQGTCAKINRLITSSDRAVQIPVRLVTFRFKTGATVYHWRPEELISFNRPSLIPAGTLRATGRGLVMDAVDILWVSTFEHQDQPDENSRVSWWMARCRDLRAIAPEIAIIERSTLSGTDLFLICKTDADLVLARMMFPLGQVYPRSEVE